MVKEVTRMPAVRNFSAFNLSNSLPIHESAIRNKRLIVGAELREVNAVIGGRPEATQIFFKKGFNFAGLDSIRVLYQKKFHDLPLTVKTDQPKIKPAAEIDLSSRTFSGIAVSGGYAKGKAMLWHSWEKGQPIAMYSIGEKDIEKEVSRFKTALSEAVSYYEGLINDVNDEVARSIFVYHLAMLMENTDRSIAKQIEAGIIQKKINAEHITHTVINWFVGYFEGLKDEKQRYISGRGEDIKNVGQVLIEKLTGVKRRKKLDNEKVVLVADEVLASDMGEIYKARKNVLAIITAKGGLTSHAAIIARNIEVPAVLGIGEATSLFHEGDLLTVDGRLGKVTNNPPPELQSQIEFLRVDHEKRVLKVRSEVRGQPAKTKDGQRIILEANILSPMDMGAVKYNEADGIGLFRTEMLIAGRKIPSVEEQKEAFETVGLAKGRTVDLGGDKLLGNEVPPEMRIPHQTNPFLGLRGVRLYNYNDIWRNLFRNQIRAMLMASAGNPGLSIMFPMISTRGEFRWARGVVEEEKQKLKGGFNKNIKVGMMVEVPSVVSFIEKLAREADYFSFGSNDMLQYLTAVDRGNPDVAYLYDPFSHTLIYNLRRVIHAAHEAGKTISLCGNMAADPMAALLLIGLGIDSLSMEPSYIPMIKYVLKEIESEKIREFANKACRKIYKFRDPHEEAEGEPAEGKLEVIDGRPTRKQLESLMLDVFELEQIDRINLVSGRLSGIPT